jgi:hypothetical protein
MTPRCRECDQKRVYYGSGIDCKLAERRITHGWDVYKLPKTSPRWCPRRKENK